jgi:hypothetical protein
MTENPFRIASGPVDKVSSEFEGVLASAVEEGDWGGQHGEG